MPRKNKLASRYRRYQRSAARILRDRDWRAGCRGTPVRYEDDENLAQCIRLIAASNRIKPIRIPAAAAKMYLET